MNPKFEYYFQADPVQSKPMYALYDVLDRHFMIQSANYNVIYRLMHSMRSKTYLELAVLPYRDDINNSNIEQWGIANLPNSWFGDLTGIKKAFNPSRHLSEWSIDATSLELQPSSTKFDSFKQDLQQQLFFFYHCIEFAENNPSILVDTVIKHGIEMSDGYDNILDVMLNDIVIENAADRVIFYDFIRQTGLCYE